MTLALQGNKMAKEQIKNPNIFFIVKNASIQYNDDKISLYVKEKPLLTEYIRQLKKNYGFLTNIWNLILKNKKWWLIPFFMVLCLLTFAVTIIGGGAILPAIYAIF